MRGVEDGVKKPLTKMVEASHCLSCHSVSTNATSKSSFVPRNTIAFRLTGQVKWFHVRKGYGFIHTEDLNSDVFIHYSAIVKNNPRKFMKSVAKGEIVEFDVVMNSRNLPEAANVTGPNNKPVRGSRYAADKRLVYTKSFKLQQPLLQNSYMNYSCYKLGNQQQRDRRSNYYRRYYNSNSSPQLTRKDLRSYKQSFNYYNSQDSLSETSESGYESEKSTTFQNSLGQGNMKAYVGPLNLTDELENNNTYNLRPLGPVSYAETLDSDE